MDLEIQFEEIEAELDQRLPRHVDELEEAMGSVDLD
jgi:hypothetical protein